MDDGIDKAAQDDPEWVVWSSPQHIAEEIDRLFTETLPSVPIGGLTGWTTPAGKVVGPMPQGVDRYSNEMADHWLSDVFRYFFPDEDALFEPDRADVVTQFLCYIGEYFVRYCGGRWINDPEARVLHEFGPTIRYDWAETVDYPVNMLFDAAEAGFISITFEWHSRAVDYAEAHGIPHEGVELRRKHGLA
ncbi:hypothetical protein [Nocardia brevicatena]|uniref:hypothetical protein n=1 Tax=Nocardia brevicatena TaxID=37327 RepID=UPI0002EA10B7|nr:hypothetical protein [Nocardia brevicatena]